jgi:hypothetical protein
MSEQDKSNWTGDRDRFADYQRQFDHAMSGEQLSADGAAVALAIRAGLAEIAVEVSSIRGFGVGQQSKRA